MVSLQRVQRLQEDKYIIKRGKYLELSGRAADVIGSEKYYFRRNEIRRNPAEIVTLH